MKPHSVKFVIKETNINFYAWRLIEEGFFQPLVKRYCGGQLKLTVMKIEKDAGFWAVDLNNWFELGKKVLVKLEKQKLPVNRLFKEHLQKGQRIFKLCDQLAKKDLTQIKNKQFIKWFKEAWQVYLYLSGLGFISAISDYEHLYLTNKLTEILENKKVKEEKIQNYLSILSSFSRPTLYWREKLDLLAICQKLKDMKKIKISKKLEKHVQKYFWLNYGYQGPLWTKKDFLERVRKFLTDKKSISQQYLEHKNHLKKIKKQQLQLEKKLKLNQLEKWLFKAAKEFMFLKAYRIEVRHRFQYTSDQVFKELSRRFSLSITEFRYALRKEILKILSGKKVNHQQIIARRNLMIFVTEKQKTRFIEKNQINKFLKKVLITEVVDQLEVIKGQTAFSGLVKGKVKIVNSIEEIKKVNKNDILVSISTKPDLLPAMIKAAAFVTETGGITSHAAIVAREMKKPCVIGTKIATKVLKDGDKVEVDATKGTIKKL